MKSWANFFKVIFLIIGISVLSFNALLYNSFEEQKLALSALNDQHKAELQDNNNKFKYQQDQIEHITKDLEDAQQQMKTQQDTLVEQKDELATQKDALLQEVGKRQQIEDQSKGIQISLVDIKAEADAIKQDMKGWQKDYVSVLAELDKKMDDTKIEVKSVKDNLDSLNIPELKENINSLQSSIDKMAHPVDNTSPDAALAPEKKIESSQAGSQ